ncbi:MAG TPA: inorganic pyrophosphatase [Halieaceae bacterium]|nr:inorganic pyrophosphatase [Halieaceae bacterium]
MDVWSLTEKQNLLELPAYSEDGFIQMVVEISAGTNIKREYDQIENTFPPDQINGFDRTIQFLQYLGNYGFIPSTLMEHATGGDGDALDVLLLSETLPSGAIVEIIPIALLKLEDNGEVDNKIVASPVDKSERVVSAKSYSQLHSDYVGIIDIIRLWFINHKGQDTVKFVGWGDEVSAKKEIDNWLTTDD